MCNDYLKLYFILYLITLCHTSTSFQTQNCHSHTTRDSCLHYDNCLYAENIYKHFNNSECISIVSIAQAKQFCTLFYDMNKAEGFIPVTCQTKHYTHSHS